jgi:hypothetical protein
MYRYVAPICALLAFCALSALYLNGNRELYEAVIHYYGVVPFRFPFVDISGSLAAWECARQGIDVVLSDPCDVLQRPYNYSPLWMDLSSIPLRVRDTPVVGWGLDLLFLVSLIFVPPPRRLIELILVLAATLSTMVVFALERANPDILLFMLALATGFLAEGRPILRVAGCGIALFSALLKYYPLMVLIVVLRERWPRLLAVSAAIAAIVALFWCQYHVDIIRGFPTIVTGPYMTDLFAAKNLPSLTGDIVQQSVTPSPLAPLAGRITVIVLYTILAAGSFAICRRILATGMLHAALEALDRFERVFLVIGSAVIVGCFFAGQSIGYRGVFLLLVLPGMLGLARVHFAPGLRRLSLGTGVVIVLLMWGECFRLALDQTVVRGGLSDAVAGEMKYLFWLSRELGWWWAISVMIVILADFVLHSPAAQSLWSLHGRWLGRAGDVGAGGTADRRQS